MPEKNVFLGIVLLRIIFPIDIISYALGMFSKVSLRKYTLATLVGYAPIVFVLSYFGKLPANYQLSVILVAVAFILLFILLKIGLSRKAKKKVLKKVKRLRKKSFG